MRGDPLAHEVEQVLLDEEARLNTWGEFFDHQILGAKDAWQIVRDGIAEPRVEMVVKMAEYSRVNGPYEAYSGAVEAAEVAQWYTEHGYRLFRRNIRTWLGPTPENSGMMRTLAEDPHSFWYFNNGITVLCDSAEPVFGSKKVPERHPVRLTAHGASVPRPAT